MKLVDGGSDCCLTLHWHVHQKMAGTAKNPEEKTAASRDHGTIFAIGISRISSAPQALSCGMSWFTIFFGTTVWML